MYGCQSRSVLILWSKREVSYDCSKFDARHSYVITSLTPPLVSSVAPYVDNVFVKGIEFDSEIRARSYDLLIVTPGPTVNELGHCINAAKTPKDVVIPPAE